MSSSIDPLPNKDGAAIFAKSCLITDDSPTIRHLARKILAPLGFEVDEAENGQVALEKCRARMPDLVLLDWNMPVMDGLEFMRKLRGTRGGNVPAVVFCTTESGIKHIRLAIDSGADDYIMKPFDKESLILKVAAVLHGR